MRSCPKTLRLGFGGCHVAVSQRDGHVTDLKRRPAVHLGKREGGRVGGRASRRRLARGGQHQDCRSMAAGRR